MRISNICARLVAVVPTVSGPVVVVTHDAHCVVVVVSVFVSVWVSVTGGVRVRVNIRGSYCIMFARLTGRRFSLQDENRELVDRLMTYKSKDAEKLNEENDHIVR